MRLLRKKQVISVFLTIMLLILTFGASFPVSADSGKDYVPMDVVLVVDISGSMKTADQDQIVLDEALQLFVNMMRQKPPKALEQSRVGIVCFEADATTYTRDASGNPAFIDLDKLNAYVNGTSNVEPVNDILRKNGLSGYSNGNTCKGAGLKNAVELFQKNSRPGAQSMVVLFSDGVDDYKDGNSNAKAMKLESQGIADLTESVSWLSNQTPKIPVNSIAFNYNYKGGQSLGAEGMQSLQEIADKTGGTVYEVNSIEDVRQSFLNILGTNQNSYDLPAVYPIEVSEEIVEVDISIIEKEDSLQDADIVLKKPDGTEVNLENDANVKYYRASGYATIKMMMPESGTWNLEIYGDGEVSIGEIRYSDMGIKIEMETPASNPEGVAFPGEEIIVRASIYDPEGGKVEEEHYDTVEEAVIEVTPNGGGASKTYQMEYDPGSKALVGKFQKEGDSVDDIKVSIKAVGKQEKESFQVSAGNYPLHLTGKNLENQKLKVRKTVEITDIYSVVEDPEGDPITASITSYMPAKNSKIIDARVDGDKIVITGKKWGSVLMTVTYEDPQGNKVTRDVSVSVTDPLLIILLSSIPFLIGIAVAVILAVSAVKSRMVKGEFTLRNVKIGETFILINANIKAGWVCKGGKGSFRKIASAFNSTAMGLPNLTQEQKNQISSKIGNIGNSNPVARALGDITVTGTPMGAKGIVITLGSEAVKSVKLEGRGIETKGEKYYLDNNKDFKLIFDDGDFEMAINYNKNAGKKGK